MRSCDEADSSISISRSMDIRVYLRYDHKVFSKPIRNELSFCFRQYQIWWWIHDEYFWICIVVLERYDWACRIVLIAWCESISSSLLSPVPASMRIQITSLMHYFMREKPKKSSRISAYHQIPSSWIRPENDYIPMSSISSIRLLTNNWSISAAIQSLLLVIPNYWTKLSWRSSHWTCFHILIM